MNSGEKYLFAAYMVVLLAVLVWVAIHALRVARLERDIAELAERLARRERSREREEATVG